MSLPEFRYHPDPLATGSIKASDTTCVCCEQARGYIYTASTYSEDNLEESLCPWCIADGTAAAKFDVTFSDAGPLLEEDISEAIVDEVTKRTPGFTSWQQELWLCCCDDACEFHGDATRAELKALKGDALEEIMEQLDSDKEEWKEFLKVYEPGGSPAVYHFVCRHCRQHRYGVDFD
jgi:uncharacterized protein CbrC (UPF0167 family)